MNFLFEYGLFFAKALTIVIAIAAVLVVIMSVASKPKPSGGGSLQLESLSEGFDDLSKMGKEALLTKEELKQFHKDEKKKKKHEKSSKKGNIKKEKPNNLFVVTFNGTSMAKEVETLRKEITAILCIAKRGDEVLVKVDSGGGVVHGYGLAASQLQRIKDKGLPLTISIDKIAASGGYMMACVADKVIAAPFAIVGSIGVIAQIPNFNKLLKKNDIDFEMHTAGQFKRTLTLFGENTEEGREKFQAELEDVHVMFKEFVAQNRTNIDIDAVATGEYWYGLKAKELNLVDDIQTSDDFLMNANASFKMFTLKYASKKTVAQKLGLAMSQGIENGLSNVLTNVRNWRV
ncbi:serine protease SohB [Glaciecola punicea ACAM 611]|uniref:Serine protease SohB n=1 Tax=Glaciecola punicea ACAM 611 TaxID=1121923 RepID=H5TA64_9ALTE|nr:protease SohB [Glaciecola punicea]OFA33470.1 protease SohB [Glaciecola punicea]GAB55191.1 serine protease SohB [Glaciecola punicea ACAM 611]